MIRSWLLLSPCCLAALVAGCGGDPAVKPTVKPLVETADDQGNAVLNRDDEATREAAEGDGSNRKENSRAAKKPLSREDLQAYLDHFKTTSPWTFGERADGFPTGTWHSQDDDRAPVIFAKDGSLKVGFLWRDGAGKMGAGLYAVSDDRVVYVARHGEVNFSGYFVIKRGGLQGPRGPMPRVPYKRMKVRAKK